MKKSKSLLSLALYLFILFPLGSHLFAQDKVPVDSSLLDRITELEKQSAYTKPGEDHFMVVGLTTIGWNFNKTTVSAGGVGSSLKTNSFPDDGNFEFSPMLLWRHGNKFLLEFEPSFSSGGQLGVNWADVSYFALPGVIIRAGYFVLPFGTYNKRLSAGWIDKLATNPPVADIPNASDYGIEVEGGFPLGNMKWNYDVSLTNGNQLQADGEIQGVGSVDNNKNKAVTARLGLLPFSNSSLEIGVSGQIGTVGDAGAPNQNAQSQAYALDLNYVKLFSTFLVNIKGQYNNVFVTNQTYVNPNDSTQYSFNNRTTTGYAQISLRQTGSSNNLIKNLEVAYRYSSFISPANSFWGQKNNISEAALLYWISWRTVVKCAYQWNNSNSTSIGSSGITTQSNSLIIQFSIQL
jgi:hypothetical protein